MERMDIYDEDRRFTGRTLVRGEPIVHPDCLTVVHVCIFRPDGKLLIQRRQSCKKAWPNAWDLSAGGGVQAGETSRRAAEREVEEELGCTVDLSAYRPVLTANFENGFDDYYLLELDIRLSQLRLQAEEVAEVRWAEPEEVLIMLDQGEFLPYVPEFLKLLFALQKNGRNFLTE